jgi:uncharacterized membrane protein
MEVVEQTETIPLPHAAQRQRNLPASAAFGWLAKGWRDLWRSPMPSLFYGLVIFALSVIIIRSLFWFEFDYILFPALAGFMVMGPFIAIGLYQKSRDIEAGKPVSLARMLFVKTASGAQVWYTGAILCVLLMVWMRAAVIIYALFFAASFRSCLPRPRVGACWLLELQSEGYSLRFPLPSVPLLSPCCLTKKRILLPPWARAYRWYGIICR